MFQLLKQADLCEDKRYLYINEAIVAVYYAARDKRAVYLAIPKKRARVSAPYLYRVGELCFSGTPQIILLPYNILK